MNHVTIKAILASAFEIRLEEIENKYAVATQTADGEITYSKFSDMSLALSVFEAKLRILRELPC